MDESEEVRGEIRNRAKLRRFGTWSPSCCRCGENRPAALLHAEEGIVCYECRINDLGRSSVEDHHIAGRRNDSFTIPLSGNDHRCVTDLQSGWPTKTLRNPHDSLLLKEAAWLRGLSDLFIVWAEYLCRVARLLEGVEQRLEKKFGVDVAKRLSSETKRSGYEE